MNENIEILKEIGSDVKKGLFTIKGLKRQWLFLTNTEEWERTDEILKQNFCKKCNHHKKHHEKSYDGIGFCRKCWQENLKLSGHNFNEDSPELFKVIEKNIPQCTMIHSDKFRIYIYANGIHYEQLKKIESYLSFTINDIEILDRNKIRLILWKVKHFCRYCSSPFESVQRKMEHENGSSEYSFNCYRKPKEVTFADTQI